MKIEVDGKSMELVYWEAAIAEVKPVKCSDGTFCASHRPNGLIGYAYADETLAVYWKPLDGNWESV